MATKRIIQLPTLNQNNQITWGNSSQWGYLRQLPSELPWWDGPNPKNVIQTPQTDANGNITGWWWKKTAMNSPEEPEVWTYRGNNGVVQTINKNTTPTNWWFTQYSSKTDRSAAVMNANKNGTVSSLPQATPAGLPWKWKMRDPKNYVKTDFWKANNQAGIDLVNKQNELDTLSKAEQAQRLAGAYNPTPPPTVATAQNPVIKKTMDKPQEETVTPAILQGADINTLNSTLDELNYKVNVEGKQLSKDEYLVYASAKRQIQEMMKPKEYTWYENVINDTKNLIEKTKKEEAVSNAEELARYTQSQDKRKESQLAILDEQEMTSKKRLASILWWSGQWQSTDTDEQFKALEDSFTLRKQEKINEMQDRIDLYGATLRKDSKETIQALEKRLADQQMKVVDIDLKNLDIINAYNEKQWLSQLEKIDKLQQMAGDIIANNTPLTDQQKADAAMRSNKIIKPDWTFDRELWEILKKQNPMIAAEAVRQSTAIQNERIQSELAMKWLDADIKRAQLNKLLNPDVDYKVVANDDWTYTRTWSDWSVAIVDPKSWASTSAIETIKKREWFRDKAYQDSTGTWTIGYWFTNVDWKPVQPWMTMDRWTADQLLWQEISQRQNYMNYITVPLSDSQKAALSSFEFNLWSGIRAKNAKPILDKINAGDLQGAGNLMKQYTTSKWQQLQGLVNRRNEEARLLLAKDSQTESNPSWKKQLPAWNASEIGAMRTAIDQTKNLWSIIEKYKEEMWPIAWNIWKINKFDTDAQTANAEFNRITQIIGKSLEWGKLAEGDIKRYLEMLPNITDNPEVAKNKLVSSQQYLNDLYAWQVKSLGEAWYNVKDFYKWIEQPQEQVKWWSIDDLRNDL